MKTSATAAAITGTTTLTHGDNLRFMMRWMPLASILLGIIPIALGITYYSASGISPFWRDPGQALFLSFKDMWRSALILGILFPTLMFILQSVQWIRLPSRNKIIFYSVDETGITTSDAAGTSLQTPWSTIVRSSRTRNYLVMKMKSGGLRFAPWRAFSPADAGRLWSIVQSKTRSR